MKKITILLFVVLIVIAAGCTFGKARLGLPNKPICPDWAVNKLGLYCESESLSITPPDIVSLVTWQIGQIQLHEAWIDNVYGVTFYAADGTEVQPRDMQDGVLYSFERTDSYGGVFQIHLKPGYNSLTPATHVVIAKSIQNP